MVTSVSPMRCVTLARWLTRGIFSSVGWLPFLNCASALLARRLQPANPAQKPRTHFDILCIAAPSSLIRYDLVRAPSPGETPPAWRRRHGRRYVSTRTEESSRGSREFTENLEGTTGQSQKKGGTLAKAKISTLSSARQIKIRNVAGSRGFPVPPFSGKRI